MGGINCKLNSDSNMAPQLVDIPIDVEVLWTVNEMSLLETENPKQQIVVEVSPVHLMLSEHRLDLLSAAKTSFDFSVLDTTSHLKRRRKPDPPRIEILSLRILHSIDLTCKRVQVALVKDSERDESLSFKLKELVMEECLSDFLSVVSCFDFSLPNEEALSSAMQVCIGRLVGLGLNDDEAWGCTNAARLNFLDDIALMRRAQADVLVQLSTSIDQDSRLFKTPLYEEGSEDEESASTNSENFAEESLADCGNPEDDDEVPASLATDTTVSDDDSANSADIVETTLHNAVEKTVATFSPLLQEYHSEFRDMKSILTFDLPLGLRMSMVQLFYDKHITVMMTSLVVTNLAGIELLTLVPHSGDADGSLDEDQEEFPDQGICFSRFDLDKECGFGKGGLAMSALADDSDDNVIVFRERSRFDDIDIGEIEFLFSSKIYEDIIEEVSKLGRRNQRGNVSGPGEGSDYKESKGPSVESSMVTVASTLSMLFTSDQLVPFSRLTLEKMSHKNKKALERSTVSDVPSWSLVAESMSLQNLTPEGQFYPEVLSLLSPGETKGLPFQVRYYKSPDAWQFSSRLEIEFTGFRLYLIRQFIYEILHYFVYDRYGVGRLKNKYSKDVRDRYGNQKPPLLYSVKIYESSVICPRCSTSSDMVSFEVKEASVAVSYIPESFKMPTESSCFEASPKSSKVDATRFSDSSGRRSSILSSVSDYQDCVDESNSESDKDSSGPISSFSKDLKKRLAINLQQVSVFTAIAKDKPTRNTIESPLFRFFNGVDGRAQDGKSVYLRKENVDRQPSVSPESLLEAEMCEQYWEEISTNLLNIEVFADYAPHMRLFIGSREGPLPFSLDARLSQLCLLLSVWDSNMQEMPTMFPFVTTQVSQSANPPTIPDDFPTYGTEKFVSHLEDLSSIRSEICVIFKKLSLRCTFDPPGHFPVDPNCFQYIDDPACPDEDKPGLILTLDDAVIHVVNDFLNVKRIGIGASSLALIDERRIPIFQRVLETAAAERDGSDKCPPSWADLGWGLRTDIRTLSSSLPLPVQFTVFMTPGWSLINVGAQSANAVMHELSWIWLFLDYFKSYYSDVAFGNAGHQAQRWTHKVKNSLRKRSGQNPVKFEPLPGMNIDFRLWLCCPILCIPSDYYSPQLPCLRIESRTGLWYRYKSIQGFSSQEVSTTDLNLYFANEFKSPQACRRGELRDAISGVRPLIEGLSFGLRYDCNNLCNHKDVAVLIPFAGDEIPTLAVAGSELEVSPIKLSAPKVCSPFEPPKRSLGPKVCEITCIIEVLPITSATMLNFFKGPAKINEDFAVSEEDQGPPTFSVAAKVGDLRLFAIDPVLGVQLPVAVASLASVSLTATKFALENIQLALGREEAPPEDLQVTVSCHLWADYFKLGMTRSWEPLLEPFEFMLLYEQSKERGQGFSVDADSPFHVNLSGALLQILGETIHTFSSLISETFGEQSGSNMALRRSVSKMSPSKDREGALVEDCINTTDGQQVQVMHEVPKPLKREDRVAFSLRNWTGQKIRVHQQTDRSSDTFLSKPAIITYLHQTETMGLTFAATISVIKNLSIVDVPYPGLPNSRNSTKHQGSLNHAVDLQIPGFRWIQAIKVDTFGRQFETLTPRSSAVLAKILRDWRLRNAMMLLTEVGLENGGRLVTVRSLFEVRNNTTHPIKLVYNPDPRNDPIEVVGKKGDLDTLQENDSVVDASTPSHEHLAAPEEIETIQPGDVFQIPTLLLERALQMTGSHLGCLWLCPDTKDRSLSFREFFRTGGSGDGEEFEASFCSRPIQLAKLVHESAVIFQNGTGEDMPADDAKSGVQVSCPTRSRRGGGQAPFCYALEVGRSPLVNVNREKTIPESKELTQMDLSKGEKKKASGTDKKSKKVEEKIHGPVAYTLSINAPLVVVNLLPEGGRFELMHAVRRTVLWYADLQPGQQIPVHSVGLDAPLLLLVNLGFCRTPVGEGALVHHGVDTVASGKGETSIGADFRNFLRLSYEVLIHYRTKRWFEVDWKSSFKGNKADWENFDCDFRFTRQTRPGKTCAGQYAPIFQS
jgi:hypothetical protein